MEVASLKRRDHDAGALACQETNSSHGSDYVSEDEHLQNLEMTGQMQHVIGSQSMLSQEIHHMEESPVLFSQDIVGGFSQVSVNTTATDDFNSQQLAHQYGLLSQDPAARAVRTHTRAELDSQNMHFDSQGSRGGSLQGGFGTLLDAVQMFQSQEEEEEREKMRVKEEYQLEEDENGHDFWGQEEALLAGRAKKPTARRPTSSAVSPSRVSSRRSNKMAKTSSRTSSESDSLGDATATHDGKKRSKKLNLPLTKNNSTNIIVPIGDDQESNNDYFEVNGSPNNRKRKRKDESEETKQKELAKRAADLAQRTINDPELAKRLLLSMALKRENPRSAPENLPAPGHVLPEGFFWAHYPPLEKVLKDNMAEYYELSITKCQSAQQQSFNNTLVERVRSASNQQGWLYAPCFTDKNLRDRIRCYYKTHIQNAKKRLRTMVKNPTKRANARHLCSHLDMIEKNVEKNASPSPCLDPTINAVITHQDWGSAFAGNIQHAAQAIIDRDERAASFEARVAASVAVATKTIHDEVAAAKNAAAAAAAAQSSRPDAALSAPRPLAPLSNSGVLPIAATISAAAVLAPDAVPHTAASMEYPSSATLDAHTELVEGALEKGGRMPALEEAQLSQQAPAVAPADSAVGSPPPRVSTGPEWVVSLETFPAPTDESLAKSATSEVMFV